MFREIKCGRHYMGRLARGDDLHDALTNRPEALAVVKRKKIKMTAAL